MTLDLDRLLEIAEAATPGPWHAEHYAEAKEARIFVYVSGKVGVLTRAVLNGRKLGNEAADAHFIATFDPSTVRALLIYSFRNLLRLKRLEAREEKLERVLDKLVRHHTLCCDSRERCEFRREALAVLDEEALAALDGEEQ